MSVAREIAKERDGIKAFIEIDSGERRAGVDPESETLLEIGRALGTKLVGVLTHAGHSYNCRTVNEIKKVAEDERIAVTTAAHRLRAAGMSCDVVSVGSTPTMSHVENMKWVTEARPGVYMFQDLVMAGLGVCAVDDIAISVLGSVIGHQREKNWVITDAGWMALSRDRPHVARAGMPAGTRPPDEAICTCRVS